MNKLLAVIAAAGVLGGVGTFAYQAGERHGSASISAVSSSAPSVVPADPTLDAICTPQPNLPPTCTQGNYNVSLTIGSSCVNPSYEQPEEWQWTDGQGADATVRCMTVH